MSKKAMAIKKIVTLGIGLMAVLAIVFGLLVREGLIMQGDEEVGNIQEGVVGTIDSIREWRDYDRDQETVDSSLEELWEATIDDILYARQNLEVDGHCIVPFRRSLFSEGGLSGESKLSDDKRIRLLDSDDGILVMMEDESGGSYLSESFTIRDMDLYEGIVEFPDHEEDAVEEIRPLSSFANIRKEDVDTIDLEDVPRTDGEADDDMIYAPLIGYHSYLDSLEECHDLFGDGDRSPCGNFAFPNRFFDYLSDSSPNDLEHASQGLEGAYDSMLLVNNEELILVKTRDSRHATYFLNLMSNFDGDSGLGRDNEGYSFCDPGYGYLLEHRQVRDDFDGEQILEDQGCECSVAKNKEICYSLTNDNCGVSCQWNERTTDIDRETEEHITEGECAPADEDAIMALNGFAEMFADLADAYPDVCESCIYHARTPGEYADVLSNIIGNSDMEEIIDGSTLRVSHESLILEAEEGLSSDSFSLDGFPRIFADQSEELELTIEDDKIKVNGIELSEMATNDDGRAFFIFYNTVFIPPESPHGTDIYVADIISRQDVHDDFDDTNARTPEDHDLKFYDTPYFALNDLDTTSQCLEIKNKDICVSHELGGEKACFWRTRDGSSRTGCFPISVDQLTEESLEEISGASHGDYGVEAEHEEHHHHDTYPDELIGEYADAIEEFDSCYDKEEISGIFDQYDDYDFEIHERDDETAFEIIKFDPSVSGGFLGLSQQKEWYYSILGKTEPMEEC
ncbi:MAG: hypothetical protein ACLFNK_00550 [Candidatus Woesearchaeota archaeon]